MTCDSIVSRLRASASCSHGPLNHVVDESLVKNPHSPASAVSLLHLTYLPS